MDVARATTHSLRAGGCTDLWKVTASSSLSSATAGGPVIATSSTTSLRPGRSAHAWAMPCCLSREQRFRHSWALASCQCPAMWYLGCCVYGCAGLCGCALCEGVGDFVVVLTATCNFASPLFLTTPFKPFECSAGIRNKSLYIMSCFLLRGTMCYCSPHYLLLVICLSVLCVVMGCM